MSKKVLIVVSILLVLINAYVISTYPVIVSRWLRLFTCLFFLISLAYLETSKNGMMLLFFVMIALSDVFNVYYEVPTCRKLTSILKIGSYMLLILQVYNKLNFKRIKKIFFIVFVVVIVLNFLLLFQLLTNASYKINDLVEYVLLFVYGLALIGMVTAAGNYNFRFMSRRSTYFFYLAFAFVINDISGFLAYFLNYEFFFFADRIFYIIALGCTVWYVLYTNEAEDILLLDA